METDTNTATPATATNLASPWRRLPVRPRLTTAGMICLIAALFGCLAVYNATYRFPQPLRFAGRQLLWVVVGAATMAVATGVRPGLYRRWCAALILVAYLPLWLVNAVGVSVNGMRGWFQIGAVFVQPSEIAKPAFVMGMAILIVQLRRTRLGPAAQYACLVAYFGLWALPIGIQPDFGSLFVYSLGFALLYWCSGGRLTHLLATAAAALPCAWLVTRRHPYVLERLQAFWNPQRYATTTGWHIIQFQRSLAAGGLTGRHGNEGRWSQSYLPLGHSDSVFAGTAEVLGFIGATAIVALILLWVWYGQRQAGKSADEFNQLTILGLTALLAGQAFTHLSVNLGMLPPTGVTLPLVSYGGSSLVSTAIAVGIIENLASTPTQPAQNQEPPAAPPEPDGISP